MASNDVTPAIGPNSSDDYRKLSVDDLRILAVSALTRSVRADEASASVTYLGFAAIGASEADAVWQIIRITVTGTITDIKWADSDNLYNNIWANRASLTYG